MRREGGVNLAAAIGVLLTDLHSYVYTNSEDRTRYIEKEYEVEIYSIFLLIKQNVLTQRSSSAATDQPWNWNEAAWMDQIETSCSIIAFLLVERLRCRNASPY